MNKNWRAIGLCWGVLMAGAVHASMPSEGAIRLVRAMELDREQLLTMQLLFNVHEKDGQRRPRPAVVDCLKAIKPEAYDPLLGAWVTENLSATEIRGALVFLESPTGKKFVNNRYAEYSRAANQMRGGTLVEVPETRLMPLSAKEKSEVEQFNLSPAGKKLAGMQEDNKLRDQLFDKLGEIARSCPQ